MNILYCGDKNIDKGLLISVLSLVKCCKEPINFYVITVSIEANNKKYDAIPDSFIDFLDKKIKIYNSENTIKKYDISELFLKEIPLINLNTRFTPCCMLRLFADLIDDLPEKLLYLDNDIVCRRDITDFYNTDISNYEIGGVLDFYGCHFYKNNIFKHDYINSGVLLMNMSKMKANDSLKKCRNMCMTKKMLLPDQASLNKICRNKKFFSHLYNDQRRGHKKTYLRHFSTTFRIFPKFKVVTVKPWDIERLHSVLKIYEYDRLLGDYNRMYNEYLLGK